MKKGFTLAEVLITLGIIGVIAAITIPTVVVKNSNAGYATALKKSNSTLSKVVDAAKETFGPVNEWPWKGTDADFTEFFLPSLDISRNCEKAASGGCFATAYKDLNNAAFADINDLDSTMYKVVLADGVSLAYSPGAATCGVAKAEGELCGNFWVDVNGVKGPNIYGRDLFKFDMFPFSVGVKPNGAFSTAYTESSKTWKSVPIADVLASCKTKGTGEFCAARVLTEGDINY